MGREFTKAPLFRKVLQSICWQVSSGQEVVVVGNTGRFEIWDADRFKTMSDEVDLGLFYS